MRTVSVLHVGSQFCKYLLFFLRSAIWIHFTFFRHFPVGSLFFFEHVFAGEGETPPPEKQDRGPGLANEKIEAQRAQRRSSDLELVLSVLQEKNVSNWWPWENVILVSFRGHGSCVELRIQLFVALLPPQPFNSFPRPYFGSSSSL